MARTKISEFSSTAADNTDIDNINIAEGCAPSGINNAIREMMAQLKDFQTGSAGDPFNGAVNGTVGATTPSTVVATQVDITAQGDLRLQDTTGGQYVALQAPGTVATSYTLTLPVDDGTAGQALITDGSGVLSWSSAASGDVYGPASATDNAVARYDGTTGKIIQNSAVTIADDGATVIAANSTSNGLRITQTGTGNALLVEDSANPDGSPTVIDNSGKLVIGNLTALGGELLQAFGGTAQFTNTNNAFVSLVSSKKSRSTTVGSFTTVQNGDELGAYAFWGDDGTQFIRGAQITALVDGTPGTNDMPGRLVFSTTADGASTPTERMRIDNQGRVGLTESLSTSALYVRTPITGSVNQQLVYARSQIASDVTGTVSYFQAQPRTNAASFAVTNVNCFNAEAPNIGAGSSITNLYGFYSNIASGTGRWNFYANGTAANYFAGATQIASSLKAGRNATQYIEMSGDSGGNYLTGVSDIGLPKNFAIGTDANSAALIIRTGNAQGINFQTNNTSRATIDATGVIYLGATPGAESLRVTPVASAVNYWSFAGRAAGASPYVQAEGSDTNIDLLYAAKGTGAHIFYTAGFSFTSQFRIAHTASAVNYLQVTGAATGSAPSIIAQGTDTNIDLALTPKGTGVLRFGTYTAGILAQAGYITIKDAAGNTRNLLVG